MASMFDLEKLYSLLQDFYVITGIRITVFDENLSELISYPQKVAPYCEIIRESVKGYEACLECDRRACNIAAKRRSTYIYHCHAGLTEAVTPLYIGEILVGFLLFGHVFSYESHEIGWNIIEKNTSGLQVDMHMLKASIMEASFISEEYVRSAAHILNSVASYLILERIASLQQDKRDKTAVKLDSYISEHFIEKINVDSLCKTLNIGRTQLYKISQQLYGCGIAKHIRTLRIALAKELLLGSKDLSLAEVADKCGYSDYNYFITAFSRETGCSPIAWRNTHSQ